MSGNTDAAGRPRDAATVIMLRDDRDAGLEVYLMRRHRRQSFMAGAFVFPGGRLDPADCDPGLWAFGRGVAPDRAGESLSEPGLPGETAMGLYFSAVRETFEEAGVLLTEEGDAKRGAMRPDFLRKQLHEGKLSLRELAEAENLRFTLDRLQPYAHWITPEIEGKRFDTRFFLCRLPRGQTPTPDEVELTDSLWVTPEKALEGQERKDLMLMPPTLIILMDLAGFSNVDEVMAAAAARPIAPVLPQPFSVGESLGLKLPHDPEYSLEAYKQTPRPDLVSRLYLVDGRWRTSSYRQATGD